MTKRPWKTAALALLVVMNIAGCATYRYTRRAQEAAKMQNWDSAVYYLIEALARDPGNMRLKMELQRTRIKAADQHFRQGMRFKDANDLQRARTELELAVQLDPTHQYADVELGKVRKDLAILAQEGGAAKLEAIKKAAAEMKVKPPILNPASNEPMSLSFPNPTNVKDIYKAIGQAFGINILFDPKLRDNKLSIELKDVTARQALEAVMQAAGHFYKVIDEKSIIVAEDTPQNRRDYEDLVVKTFFLSNADVKDINNMLRALIDARRIAVNEQLNAITIRDTADKVAIAERLINANDKSKAEVLIDVELMQVDSHKLQDIGASLNAYSAGVTLDTSQLGASSGGSSFPLNNLRNITRSMWDFSLLGSSGAVVPSLVINLIKNSGETQTLAQPQLRITEGEKANLVIGEKVPIPSTTFNTSQTVGGNIVPITAFQYQDVGIKINVEPRVHHNDEITLKLKVEVSDLGTPVTSNGQPTQYPINTRNIETVIRLKDGETSLLAGLLKETKATNKTGIPFLADLPVVGRLFSDNSRDVTQTDLILTLTPHIIRYPDITEEDLAPIWVGTENRISIFGNSPRVRSAAPGSPFGEGTPMNAPIFGAQPTEPTEQPEAVPPTEEKIPEKPRPNFPPGQFVPPPTQLKPMPGQGGAEPEGGAVSQGVGAQAVQASPANNGLSQMSFYPARLPAVVGREAGLTVVLDAGVGGVRGPLHLAYDPARLEVTRVEGGVLSTDEGPSQVRVTNAQQLGWITADWNGTAAGSATFLTINVRPLASGELSLIFAGPTGAVTAQPATIVALPAVAATSEATQP